MSSKEWKTYKLAEITEFIGRGISPSYNETEGIVVINQRCIREGSVTLTASRYHDESKKKIHEDKKLQKFDVLINSTGTGTLGRVAQFLFDDRSYTTDSHVTIVRPKKIANSVFLSYYLKNKQSDIENLAEGSTGQTELPRKSVMNIDVDLPNKETQQRIASILSSLDDKIELNRQTNQTLEGIAQTLFQEICVPKGDELPEGWRVGKLGEICEVNKNSLNKKQDPPEWIDYIEISEVSKGIIGNVTRYLLGEEPSRAKRKLKHGDTVLSTVRPDRGSYFLAINPPTTNIVSTGFAVFSATKVPYTFLYVFLTNETSLAYYGQVANGGAYPAINPNVIMDMDLIIPKEAILNEFQKVAEPLFLQYYSNEQENQTLIALRDSLLPKLMKGEIEL